MTVPAKGTFFSFLFSIATQEENSNFDLATRAWCSASAPVVPEKPSLFVFPHFRPLLRKRIPHCPRYPLVCSKKSTTTTTTTTTTENGRNDRKDKMGSAASQPSTININENIGNVTDSYRNVWNNCEISVSDEKRHILEWLSPLAPRERHQAVREGRMDGVGNWLLGTDEFEKWHTSEDHAVNPVLFCYGDPGVGKTYLRYVKTALLK